MIQLAPKTLCCRLCGLDGHDAPYSNICGIWRSCHAFVLGRDKKEQARIDTKREERRVKRRIQLGLDPSKNAPSPYPAPNEDRKRDAALNDDKTGWL